LGNAVRAYQRRVEKFLPHFHLVGNGPAVVAQELDVVPEQAVTDS
jgi:hypothetical protein